MTNTKHTKEIKDRKRPLNVYVTPSERAKICENAKAVDMSVSEFLCSVGTGIEIKSRADKDAMEELMKINADLGRLGGLLKMAFTGNKFDSFRNPINDLIVEIRKTQHEIRKKAGELR